jgi:hypothetical protein
MLKECHATAQAHSKQLKRSPPSFFHHKQLFGCKSVEIATGIEVKADDLS